MTITIKLDTDNAAFHDNYQGEVNRILRIAVLQITKGDRMVTLLDSNGNTVGTAKVAGR